MATSTTPDSGYTPTNLPQALDPLQAAFITTDVQGLTDRFNAHTHTVDTTIADNAVTTAKILDNAVTPAKVGCISATVTETVTDATNASWADIGTGLAVTTTQNNQKVLVNFAGTVTGTTTDNNIRSSFSITVAGSGQEGTWSSKYSNGNGASSATMTGALGFSILVTVASAGATAIKLRGILVNGTKYSVAGVLSAVVLGV